MNERIRFENWAWGDGGCFTPYASRQMETDYYWDDVVQTAWDAWQAGRATPDIPLQGVLTADDLGNNDWLVKNLLLALRPAVAHGADVFAQDTDEHRQARGVVCFDWPGEGPHGSPTEIQWLAIYDACMRVMREYKSQKPDAQVQNIYYQNVKYTWKGATK